MSERIEFLAGNAEAIAEAVRTGQDPKKIKNLAGHVNLSFHLPPITSIDQLVEAVNQELGADVPSFETALEDGSLVEDEVSADLVDSGWVRAMAELGDVPVDKVFEAWIRVMSEEEGTKIAPSPKLKLAMSELFKLCRKAVAQKTSLIHIWSA